MPLAPIQCRHIKSTIRNDIIFEYIYIVISDNLSQYLEHKYKVILETACIFANSYLYIRHNEEYKVLKISSVIACNFLYIRNRKYISSWLLCNHNYFDLNHTVYAFGIKNHSNITLIQETVSIFIELWRIQVVSRNQKHKEITTTKLCDWEVSLQSLQLLILL